MRHFIHQYRKVFIQEAMKSPTLREDTITSCKLVIHDHHSPGDNFKVNIANKNCVVQYTYTRLCHTQDSINQPRLCGAVGSTPLPNQVKSFSKNPTRMKLKLTPLQVTKNPNKPH